MTENVPNCRDKLKACRVCDFGVVLFRGVSELIDWAFGLHIFQINYRGY